MAPCFFAPLPTLPVGSEYKKGGLVSGACHPLVINGINID